MSKWIMTGQTKWVLGWCFYVLGGILAISVLSLSAIFAAMLAGSMSFIAACSMVLPEFLKFIFGISVLATLFSTIVACFLFGKILLGGYKKTKTEDKGEVQK